MTGFSPPQSMEVSCCAAGHWRIEGYSVDRVRVNGRAVWQVTLQYTGVPSRVVGEARTLDGACLLVDDDRYNVREVLRGSKDGEET